jgi:hypothetical protein
MHRLEPRLHHEEFAVTSVLDPLEIADERTATSVEGSPYVSDRAA